MKSLKAVMIQKVKELTPIQFEECPAIWRCYDCGLTSEQISFRTDMYWIDYGLIAVANKFGHF